MTSDLTLAAATLTGAVWYRAESTGGPDEARGLDDGVYATVQLHLAVHAAHSSLLGCNDCHLHLSIIDQGVKDGLDVIHRQVHLQISQERACQQWAERVTLTKRRGFQASPY